MEVSLACARLSVSANEQKKWVSENGEKRDFPSYLQPPLGFRARYRLNGIITHPKVRPSG